MGISERRAREKKELRKKILEAATELFVHEGYSQVTVRKIAQRIEYAPSTIYLYFKDKATIISSICGETFSELDLTLEAIRKRSLPPLEMLRESLGAYIRFGLDHPNHYIVTFCLPHPKDADALNVKHSNAVMDAGLASFQRLRDGIHACMKAGVIATADVEITSQSVWATIHGITSLLITQPEFPFVDRDTLIGATLDRVLKGLVAPAAWL